MNACWSVKLAKYKYFIKAEGVVEYRRNFDSISPMDWLPAICSASILVDCDCFSTCKVNIHLRRTKERPHQCLSRAWRNNNGFTRKQAENHSDFKIADEGRAVGAYRICNHHGITLKASLDSLQVSLVELRFLRSHQYMNSMIPPNLINSVTTNLLPHFMPC